MNLDPVRQNRSFGSVDITIQRTLSLEPDALVLHDTQLGMFCDSILTSKRFQDSLALA